MRHRAFAAAGLAGLLALVSPAPAGAQEVPEPNTVYEFDTVLAPVCVDGAFPLSILTVGGPIGGTLQATTDDRGRVSGTVTLAGEDFQVSGWVRFRDGDDSVHLVAKGPSNRFTFSGTLEAVGFSGSVRGKGPMAPGLNTFILDLGAADATVASATIVIPPGAASGAGTLDVCGPTLPLTGRLRVGGTLHLSLHAGGFRWKGTGPVGASPDSVSVSWSARGFGAKVRGEGMALEVVPPPSGLVYAQSAVEFEAEEPAAPDVPVAGGGPVLSWTVEPALPAGLALDPLTGVIAGTPVLPAAAADYTVTAGNLAGSATATVNLSVRINRAYSFAPEARALTDDDLRHFLGRTHFGVKDAELASLRAAGLDAAIDDMLDFRSGTAVEAAAFPELVNASDPPGLQGGFPNAGDLSRWWLRIMVETDRPFQEVLAFFWHDHFSVSTNTLDGGMTHWMVGYANLFRHGGTGNLRDLLLAMARDPAMLRYLDGYVNTRTAPNENFGREFWELFTLGVDNGYTQADIVQAARAFTGYRARYISATGQYVMEFDPNRHDTGSKTILGTTIPGQSLTDDYAAVVDITLANRPVAEYLTRKLFEDFCYAGPPQSLVDSMAATLRGANWELKPFLKALLRSEAFYSSRSRFALVKSPVEYGVGFMRSTNLRLPVGTVDYFMGQLGQQPTLPPPVNGWPLGTLWLSAAAMVNRTNLVYSSVGDTARQRAQGIEIAAILPPIPQRTADAVVDAMASLLRVPLAAAERTRLIDYLNSYRQANGTIVPSPFDGSNQAQLDERVRGLLYILVQNPIYHLR